VSDDASLEGWFDDPYGRHEARWLSMGRPTHLVRDGDIEASDPIADVPFEAASLTRSAPVLPIDGAAGMRRADDTNRYSRIRWGRRRGYPPWTGQSQPSYYQFTQGQIPMTRRTVPVDTDRPTTVALFLSCGFIGWSLFGVVLVCAPAPWVAPVLGISSVTVFVQYVAWRQLGGSITLLWPNPLAQMGRIVGLPRKLILALVYASMTWVALAAVARWHMGARPLIPDRHWMEELARSVLLLGAAASAMCLIADRGREAISEAKANRGSTKINATGRSWLHRMQLRRWAGQILVISGTVGVFLLVSARLG
jgi:hypothetical protein